MFQRLLTGVVGIPILVGAIILGAPWITVILLIAGVAAIWELYRTPPVSVAHLPFMLGAAWVLALLLGAQAGSGRDNFLIISGVIIAAGSFSALLWFIAHYRPEQSDEKKSYLVGFAYLILGPIYVGFLLSHALMIREISLPEIADTPLIEIGASWLLFALLSTFAVDTGAYLVGRSIGKHPMAPSISPNKTWEGSVGGWVSALVTALALGQLLELNINVWQQIVIGAVVGVVAQLGDLLVSKLKRITGIKDTGSIIPGHGGMLDRLDSLLFTLAAVYYLIVTVFAPSSPNIGS